MESHDQISIIEALSCLGDLPLNQLLELIKRLEPKRILAQQAVYQHGDSADFVLFVGSGRLARFEGDIFRGLLTRGRMAGWNSFFHRCPRDHTLIAQNDCSVYTLSWDNLSELIDQTPGILAGILRASTPMPSTGNSLDFVPSNKQIGVFTFEDLQEESGVVFQRLMTCYENNPMVTSYSCSAFCQLAGVEQSFDKLFGHLSADVFDHLESDHDTVVYCATSNDPPEWLEKLAHQVDTLILVVKEGTQSLPTWFEELLKASGKRPGLVILKTEPGEFGIASRSLWNVIDPEWHYRLNLDDTRMWASVARMAQGHSINLVLSGGGCLGAMHCGILSAMCEANFPIDTIGGTSAGAGIAIGYAGGDSPAELARKFRYAFTEKKPFSAYTLPFHGLVNPKKLDKVLQEIAENRWLEDSNIPLHVMVTNLTLSTAEVLTRGPGWEAMRMSGSIPGILPPFLRDGHTYVDGAVMNNFPVSVAQQKYGGRHVGITFKIPTENSTQCLYEDRPSTLSSVLAKFNLAKSNDFPSMGGVLASSMTLSNSTVLKEAINQVDLLLHPPVPANINITSFERVDELYEIGVRYGEEYISKLKASGSAKDWLSF